MLTRIVATMHPLAGRIGFINRAIVAKQREREQQLFQTILARGAARQQRRCLRIEHDEVRFRARLQSADLVCEMMLRRRPAVAR